MAMKVVSPSVALEYDLFGNDFTDKRNKELRRDAVRARRSERAAKRRKERRERQRVLDNRRKVASDKINYGRDLWGAELSPAERMDAERVLRGESLSRRASSIVLSESALRSLIRDCVINAVSEMISEAKSGIHIDPENVGKFNRTKKRTGKSTEELAHSKNPLTRKRAIFAQNARKWAKRRRTG